jgi:hypothetical protein
MKLTHRAVALGAVAALTFAAPGAAYAGAKAGPKGKTKVSQQQAGKAKADQARKKAEQARKKAEQARKKAATPHFAFPGLVTAASPATSTVTIARKERGVTVVRTFVLESRTEVKRNGVRVTLADIRPGDKAVGIGTRVNGVLVLRKLNAEGAVTDPVTATPTATIVI